MTDTATSANGPSVSQRATRSSKSRSETGGRIAAAAARAKAQTARVREPVCGDPWAELEDVDDDGIEEDEEDDEDEEEDDGEGEGGDDSLDKQAEE